jgi:glutamine synthetase
MSGPNVRGRLTPDELRAQVAAGAIDTVLVTFPDMQGRLVGKRVTGTYFVDNVLANSIEVCNYLLAVDVDMNPLPGYRFANWDQGYGDVSCIPDLSTLRPVPWIERTAIVLCDVVDEHSRQPVAVSPRQVLRDQVARAEALGFRPHIGAELEFFLFRDTFEELAGNGYREFHPHSDWIEDYHILQTSREEYLIRRIRNGMDDAGIPVEFSKGEAGRGQHEINLVYAEALEMADRHAIYKNGVKEIAADEGRSVTFMAKYSMDEVGSSCHLHVSLTDLATGEAAFHDPNAADGRSTVFRHFLGGLLASARELSWCFAPFVNSYKRYQPDSWAPTAVAYGLDNRTCGFRLVGRGPAFRVESRIPGADVNPYIAYAALIAAGLHGIEHGIEPPPPLVGNGYTADVEHLPSTLPEAIQLFDDSTLAREAFGDDVHHHLLNTARQEWLAFNRAVTDWELRRNFERI